MFASDAVKFAPPAQAKMSIAKEGQASITGLPEAMQLE